ncbi:BRAT1 protein, partial [Acromyrmex insinuator]
MNSCRKKNEEVLAKVLNLFLLPDYNVVSPTYLDHLLTHIAENTKECATVDYEYCEVFQEWIPKALAIWETGQKASHPVITFTLKLVGIISRHELRYHYWHCQDVYNRLYKILQLHREDLPASIKMAYTTMLSDLIVHRSGRQWVIQSGVWKDVVKYAHWNQTMYVTRESQKFLWTLLLHEHKNTETCKEIILAVAAPLMSNILDGQMHQALETYLEQNKLLCSTLNLLTNILENTLFASLDNSIPELIERLVDLEMRVKALFEACISTRFLQHVHKLLLLSLFLKLKQGIKEHTTVIETEAWHKFCYGMCYIFMMLLSKKDIIELVKNNKFSMTYWKKLLALHEFVLPEQHKFEHQAIAIMIIPLCVCIKKNHLNHDLFDMFINKIFDVTCVPVQRLLYNMRDVIRKSDLPMEQICKVSIDLLLEISDIMDRDVAVITFQALSHVLKSYMPDIWGCGQARNCTSDVNSTSPSEHPRKLLYKSILDGDPIVDSPILLASLLDGLAVMTEKFKLKWQECVETICMLSLAQEILNHPGILPTICVKALRLCKLAIHNFMPPNLALLVDSDSNMNEIGPTLFKRLHDPNWEVRDSVLEVLNTIATISEDKYPAFQDFLLINQFPTVAVEIIKTDNESYVRASALTFIATMVRINKLWELQLSQKNLTETAIHLLKDESEAIVRRDAVNLIKELYVHQKWSKEVIDSMLRAMCMAAVFDLHWEVKTNALSFWDHFVKSHLTDQGMLDDSFPNVTFSKEHRKIVALNETEIKRRLNKALDELARQSCLGVLLVTLKDDSDFEVCKASAAIISKLKTCLLKYKLDEPPSPVENHATIDTVYVKETSPVSSSIYDKKSRNASHVIEEIVDANDANLLATIYKNSMNMDAEMPIEEEEKEEKKTLRYISSVTRQDFLHAIFNCDIDAYIKEKNRWLKTYTSSFESILDDILTMHKQNDVNSMDCY